MSFTYIVVEVSCIDKSFKDSKDIKWLLED